MNQIHKTIAILGATGHIAKSLIHSFKDELNFTLHLFTRSIEKTEIFVRENGVQNGVIKSYRQLNDFKYSSIINCVGIGDPSRLREFPDEIFFVTEEIDLLAISYLRKNPTTTYINFSSGAVYGTEFNSPVQDTSSLSVSVNNLLLSDYYGIAKINAEAKHRALKNYKIIDLRIFGFYSRFIELDRPYLLSEVLRSLKSKKLFVTSNSNIIRDYIYPKDLAELIKLCMIQNKMNAAFDVCSKKNVTKFELLDFFKTTYNFNYTVIDNSVITSVTGSKEYYFSESKRIAEIGFEPQYTSLECISLISKEILK